MFLVLVTWSAGWFKDISVEIVKRDCLAAKLFATVSRPIIIHCSALLVPPCLGGQTIVEKDFATNLSAGRQAHQVIASGKLVSNIIHYSALFVPPCLGGQTIAGKQELQTRKQELQSILREL